MKIDHKAVATLKMNGVAAINEANSGHPGIVLGAANIINTIYTKHLRISSENKKWVNRDRFVLSAGHGSALLYSMLEKIDFITMDDLKKFRKLGSITPGHPEYGLTPGVDATTGPLGQGIATAVGMAIAESHLNERFEELDHHTFVLCGDGDLQEGISYEAMSLAGKMKLDKLIVLHDSNSIQLDAGVDEAFDEDLRKRMESMNWNYIQVTENRISKIDSAISKAKKWKDKPTFIEVKTVIGEGTNNAGTSSVHGAPLSRVDLEALASSLEWEEEDNFTVGEDVKKFYRKKVLDRGEKAYNNFNASKGLVEFLEQKPVSIKLDLPKNEATRVTSGEIIKYLNEHQHNWIGGSADLTSSTKAKGADGNFNFENRRGRNIMFGVREFAMAAIANGIALHSNFKPFVSTFFTFSDYLKPALRLSALMKLPVTYILTHDSIFVGEDGPTHEPIEQYAMIRSIPNVNLMRPANEDEVLAAYDLAISSNDKPTIITLTRQPITSIDNSDEAKTKKGAYIVHEGNGDARIIATGSEVALAVEVGKKTGTTVISMPSTNLFDEQSEDYKKSILGNYDKTLTIEAASTFGWGKYGKHNLGIDTFGESGDGNKIYEKLGFTIDNISEIVNKIK